MLYGLGPGYITHVSDVPNAHTHQPTHGRGCQEEAGLTSLVLRECQLGQVCRNKVGQFVPVHILKRYSTPLNLSFAQLYVV